MVGCYAARMPGLALPGGCLNMHGSLLPLRHTWERQSGLTKRKAEKCADKLLHSAGFVWHSTSNWLPRGLYDLRL